MNIRKELLEELYSMVSNNAELYPESHEKFCILEEMCEKNFPKEKEDDYMSAMCALDHAAFMAGANLVLDFISGREVS